MDSFNWYQAVPLKETHQHHLKLRRIHSLKKWKLLMRFCLPCTAPVWRRRSPKSCHFLQSNMVFCNVDQRIHHLWADVFLWQIDLWCCVFCFFVPFLPILTNFIHHYHQAFTTRSEVKTNDSGFKRVDDESFAWIRLGKYSSSLSAMRICKRKSPSLCTFKFTHRGKRMVLASRVVWWYNFT